MAEQKFPKEIVNLSQERMSVDLNETSVEELERRLELSLVAIIPDVNFDCPSLSCSTFCMSNCPTVCSEDCLINLFPNQP